jgi:hypothetical protein
MNDRHFNHYRRRIMEARDLSDLDPIERNISQDPQLNNQDKDSLTRILERARTKILDLWEDSLNEF